MSSSLNAADLVRLCTLARLAPPADAANSAALVDQLNRFFELAQALQALPLPANIEPLIHPTAMTLAVDLPLAQDVVGPIAPRSASMQNAPAQAEGVFLVPRVIE